MYQVRCHPCNKFKAGTHVIFHPFDLLPVGGQDPPVLLVVELVPLSGRGLHLQAVLGCQWCILYSWFSWNPSSIFGSWFSWVLVDL